MKEITAVSELTTAELLACLPHQDWKNVLQMGGHEVNEVHDWVCARAGDGVSVSHRQLVDALGDSFRATCFESILILVRAGLPVIYSFDGITGDVCVELVSRGCK